MDHYIYFNENISSVDGIIEVFRESQSKEDLLKRVLKMAVYQKMVGQVSESGSVEDAAESEEDTDGE